REVDLIEEVARIDGLERLPATLPSRPDAGGRLTAAQRARRRVEDLLAGHGLLESAGWSFQAPDVVDRLRLAADDPRRSTVRLRNPLSEDQSTMKTLRSEEHTSELQSLAYLVCRPLLEKHNRNRRRGACDRRREARSARS